MNIDISHLPDEDEFRFRNPYLVKVQRDLRDKRWAEVMERRATSLKLIKAMWRRRHNPKIRKIIRSRIKWDQKAKWELLKHPR